MNFTLRRPRIADLESYAENIIDATIAKNFMTNPTNIKQAKIELQNTISNSNRKDTDIFFIIINDKAVGEVGLCNIIPDHKAKLSYWIGKKFRGKGIMTKAIGQVAKRGFDKYKLKRIYAYVRTFNKPSARVLERCGFRREGILRKNKLKDRKYLDDYLYAKVR